MSDPKAKAHKLGISLAALALMESQIRKLAKEEYPDKDIDAHRTEVAVPVHVIKAITTLAEDTIQLLSEVGLIDPVRVKAETAKQAAAAEKEHMARQALMRQLQNTVGKMFGGGLPPNIRAAVVSGEQLQALMEAAGEEDDDESQGCGNPDCPACSLHDKIQSGELDIGAMGLPEGIEQVMSDYQSAVSSEAVTPAAASMHPGNPRVRH